LRGTPVTITAIEVGDHLLNPIGVVEHDEKQKIE
jgi:hypothetical protein